MNINEILEKLGADKEIAEKYSLLKGVDAILEQAKADNFDVTRENVEKVIEMFTEKSRELSEDDLAVVAGGGNGEGKHYCPNCDYNYNFFCRCPTCE